MAIEADLRTWLIADTGVAALIGTRLLSRRPQNVTGSTLGGLPAVVMTRVDTARPGHLTGTTGLPDARFTLECWAINSSGAKTLAETIRLAKSGGSVPLCSFRGTMGTTAVSRIRIEDQRGDDLPPFAADEQALFRETLDVMICYTEPTT